MKYLAWLDRTLAAKLAETPVGRPVFLRAFLQLTSDHGVLRGVAEETIRLAARWIGSEVRSVHWQGGVEEGYWTAMVEFEAGQTALISSETPGLGEPAAELLLLGQHGSLRFSDVVLEEAR